MSLITNYVKGLRGLKLKDLGPFTRQYAGEHLQPSTLRCIFTTVMRNAATRSCRSHASPWTPPPLPGSVPPHPVSCRLTLREACLRAPVAYSKASIRPARACLA